MRLKNFSTGTLPPLDVALDNAIEAMAIAGAANGVYDDSECVTGDDKTLYRVWYKQYGGNVKAGIKARKARDGR